MEFMLNDGTPDGTAVGTDVEPVVTPEVKPDEVVAPTPSKNEILREWSKETGINLFDAEGLKAFKDFQESQKTDLEKAQEDVAQFKAKEAEWQTEKLNYEAKFEAIKLGIADDSLEDALILAKGDPANLKAVIEKYPNFRAKSGIQIGKTDPNSTDNLQGLSEREAYMAKNPKLYKKT
jgi:hypothetical protein